MAAALTCAECEETLALAALDVLGADESAGADAHLRSCAACRQTLRQYREAASMLVGSLELLEPPPQLRRRLLATVYGARPRQPRLQGLRALWLRIPQARAFTVMAAAGAAAAVALAVWASRPVDVTPSVRHFQVTAAIGQPGTRGDLTYEPASSRAVLTVSGLPAPAGSIVYEVWLIPRRGSPVAAAFLAATPRGGVWTGVVLGDVTRYATLAVTVEPAGGSPQPTGAQLLSVDLNRA